MARKAAAIKYDESLPAPFILATGRGVLADRIVALAREAGIAVVPGGELADKLVVMEAGSFIPEECFAVVAELLAYVHKVYEGKGNKSL